jgi:hypothetical protein
VGGDHLSRPVFIDELPQPWKNIEGQSLEDSRGIARIELIETLHGEFMVGDRARLVSSKKLREGQRATLRIRRTKASATFHPSS